MIEYLRALEALPVPTWDEELLTDNVLITYCEKLNWVSNPVLLTTRTNLVKLLLRDTIYIYGTEQVKAALTEKGLSGV